jgi:hypothetical protein
MAMPRGARRLGAAFALAAAALQLTACTNRLVDFTIISTKNVDLSKGASFQRGRARVEGEDRVYIIVLVPTGTPNMKEAVDRAIESVPGAVALLDGVLTQNFWYIPYVFGTSAFLVEGTPLIDPSLVAAPSGSPYRIAEFSKDGELTSSRGLAQTEFGALRERYFGE